MGSVLVVGSGIGGMQASLDLVESGFKVYLLDKTGGIGGTMSQLDKTFPTNDCAMCIMSPKLVDVGRDKNIEIIPYAELAALDGDTGHFTATIRRHPRRVDPDKCTGCGLCQQFCPLEIASEYNQTLTQRKAIYLDYPQAVPNTHLIDRKSAPCQLTCPLELDVREYVGLIASGNDEASLALIRSKLPFPASIGRICTRPCEEACLRGKEMEEPIAICQLKRFVADEEIKKNQPIPINKPDKHFEEKVAIIGGGPAGLSAAYHLARNGYPATIFEAQAKLGGMLRYGIPSYRLPRDILDREIQAVLDHGVEVKTDTRVGPDGVAFESLMGDMGYKAVFIGVGAWEGMQLRIPGEEARGVMPGIKILRDINAGEDVSLKGKIGVIGGGNVAIDVARSALRLGAQEVSLYYRRTRDEMPAHHEEVQAAIDEGVQMHFLVAPTQVVAADGQVTGLELKKMKLGEPDASGRRRPIPIEGSEFIVASDLIVPAIGQAVKLPYDAEAVQIESTRWKTVAVDPVTGATNQPGIFAGGDAEKGAYIAIDAVAGGLRAAESIHRYLRGMDIAEGRGIKEQIPVEDARPGFSYQLRQRMPHQGIGERTKSFKEVETGFSREQAVAEAERCLNCRKCLGCGICEDVCEANALCYEEPERTEKIEVGSVLMALGFEEYNSSAKSEYGYGRYDNVVTSIEFERMLSATGPFSSMPMRLSDGDIPKKIAWIQCVGSRDKDHNYCSSVCCMYATKEAIITKEHLSFVEPTIFYMDIRAHGKGFDGYYERAKNEHNVRYIRSQISRVVEDPKTNNLMLRYTDASGTLQDEEFDMVVLSVGLGPRPETRALAKKIGIELDQNGFCKTDTFQPLETSRKGVYVCGAFEAPKDIPETVAQASGAAAFAASDIAEARGTLLYKDEMPIEKDIVGLEPRVGVFVCHCGVNIGSVIDVPQVTAYAGSLPNVVFSNEFLFTCSSDSLVNIKEAINEHDINRVVVASCSPRTHEPLFRQTLQESGLNPFLFEMANIRDQCSWVHMHNHEEATVKAKELIKMAVANAYQLKPLPVEYIDINKKGLVVGGGLSGMSAALQLADQGYEVCLVEKEAELGGNLRHLHYTLEGKDVQAYYRDLVERVRNHPDVKLFLEAELVDHSGNKGAFKSGIAVGPQKEYHTYEYGVAILATGAEESKPTEYLYGKNQQVVTQQELEEKLVAGEIDPKALQQVVMIQCVGSRNEERPYCSRICCSSAIKNALKLKELNPEVNIDVVCRDIRTYGVLEEYYTAAREQGVLFTRYDLDHKPDVTETEDGGLAVTTFDPSIQRKIRINTDLLVLSSAIIPRDNDRLSNLFKVSRTLDNFYLEAHMKLRPVDFATDGVFMAGMGHAPKMMHESISQAAAAVSRACTVISKDRMQVGGVVAKVDAEKCAVCLICVRACPYDVPIIHEDGYSFIDPSRCQGCGTCVSECPNKAIDLQHFTDRQILDKSGALCREIIGAATDAPTDQES
ncbi:MAG: FAD-dependent oxidoreductase [FCB group bacterium]|nr:FAD-dependent oxidoreductase [FCB group bacterium]